MGKGKGCNATKGKEKKKKNPQTVWWLVGGLGSSNVWGVGGVGGGQA